MGTVHPIAPPSPGPISSIIARLGRYLEVEHREQCIAAAKAGVQFGHRSPVCRCDYIKRLDEALAKHTAEHPR